MNDPFSCFAVAVLFAAVMGCSGPGDEVSPAQNAKLTEPAPLPSGELVPPTDAQLLSGGHVTGGPLPDGRPGAHITWTAYTSQEAPDALAKRYLVSLGAEAHAVEGDTDIWRFPREKPVDVLEVSPASAEGPWTYEGTPVPPQAKSIIMISSMARSD